MSAIVAFLEGAGPDGAGRPADEILRFDDEALEYTHDYIQWLFPLAEASRAVPGSPVLTGADVAAIRGSSRARATLDAAAARMSAFYAAGDAWLAGPDHNHLRITRIVRSLRLLAGNGAADAFRRAILDRAAGSGDTIGAETRRFWANA
ncbi:MAG: opioid growth factor receptor-related protein [Caulobacteraceae bacterium]